MTQLRLPVRTRGKAWRRENEPEAQEEGKRDATAYPGPGWRQAQQCWRWRGTGRGLCAAHKIPEENLGSLLVLPFARTRKQAYRAAGQRIRWDFVKVRPHVTPKPRQSPFHLLKPESPKLSIQFVWNIPWILTLPHSRYVTWGTFFLF